MFIIIFPKPATDPYPKSCPLHNFTVFISKIRFNFILPCTPRSPKWTLPSSLSDETFMLRSCHIVHVCTCSFVHRDGLLFGEENRLWSSYYAQRYSAAGMAFSFVSTYHRDWLLSNFCLAVRTGKYLRPGRKLREFDILVTLGLPRPNCALSLRTDRQSWRVDLRGHDWERSGAAEVTCQGIFCVFCTLELYTSSGRAGGLVPLAGGT
jgi:hypothetical protein